VCGISLQWHCAQAGSGRIVVRWPRNRIAYKQRIEAGGLDVFDIHSHSRESAAAQRTAA